MKTSMNKQYIKSRLFNGFNLKFKTLQFDVSTYLLIIAEKIFDGSF